MDDPNIVVRIVALDTASMDAAKVVAKIVKQVIVYTID